MTKPVILQITVGRTLVAEKVFLIQKFGLMTYRHYVNLWVFISQPFIYPWGFGAVFRWQLHTVSSPDWLEYSKEVLIFEESWKTGICDNFIRQLMRQFYSSEVQYPCQCRKCVWDNFELRRLQGSCSSSVFLFLLLLFFPLKPLGDKTEEHLFHCAVSKELGAFSTEIEYG